MEKILNFEDFQAKLRVDEETKQVVPDNQEAVEENEMFDIAEELNQMDETELPDIFKEYEEITEAETEFQVTEPKMEGDSITLKINDQKYKFTVPTGQTLDIKEIFRKFEKMMGFAQAGGKALAWLHKQLGKGEKIA